MRKLLYTLLCVAGSGVLQQSVDAQGAAGAQPIPAANRAAGVATAPQATTGTGRISGRVTSTLGAPVPKATVRLNLQVSYAPGQAVQPNTFLEISGSDGSFTFENLPPGRYGMNAQRSGYGVDQTSNNITPNPQVVLTVGETKLGVDIKLSPLASISGRVVDRDGDPVQNIQVRLARYGFQQGRTVLQQSGGGATDDRGLFRIVNLQPGRYYVVAEDLNSRFQAANEVRGPSALQTNLTTYYPSAAEVRSAVKLDLKAGTELNGIDIRMIRGQVFAVRGTVTDSSGAPMQAQLTLTDRNNPNPSTGVPLQSSSQGANGQFSFGAVPAGDYILTARSNGVKSTGTNADALANQRVQLEQQIKNLEAQIAGQQAGLPVFINPQQSVLFGRFELSVKGNNIENVRLQLVPGPTVTGKVVLEGGGELGQTVTTTINGTVTQQRRPAQLMLIDMESTNSTTNGQVQTDGSFSVPNLLPSKYALNSTPLAQQYYLKSVRLGGQDVTNQLLDFSNGSAGPLEIIMGNKPAQVTGTLKDSKGETPTSATVVLWPKTPRASDSTGGVRSYRTNFVVPNALPNSSFTMPALPPGEYYIATFEDTNQQFLQIPAFLARFNGSALTVKLTEAGNETVEPKWITREATDKEAGTFPE